jgi:hypothetical protein
MLARLSLFLNHYWYFYVWRAGCTSIKLGYCNRCIFNKFKFWHAIFIIFNGCPIYFFLNKALMNYLFTLILEPVQSSIVMVTGCGWPAIVFVEAFIAKYGIIWDVHWWLCTENVVLKGKEFSGLHLLFVKSMNRSRFDLFLYVLLGFDKAKEFSSIHLKDYLVTECKSLSWETFREEINIEHFINFLTVHIGWCLIRLLFVVDNTSTAAISKWSH